MANFCTIRPANDGAALELAHWCASLLPEIKSGHTLVRDLYASGATRRAVGPALSGVRCVLFFGHGNSSGLYGASEDALIDSTNIRNAQGVIFIAIACSSAEVLGRDAVHNGVESYLGFRQPLVWLNGDPEGQFQPASISGIRRLIASGSVHDARTAMASAFANVVEFYQRGAGSGLSNSTIGWLTAFWDQEHIQMRGNPNAVL